MHTHLRDSMWFLYMKHDVSYEEFLATVYEAEKVEKVIEERERSELKDLKQQIEPLSMIMKCDNRDCEGKM